MDMLKLHGFPISNYYNMVKMTLLEKGMDFQEVLAKPTRDAEWLAASPMGKVPCLETPQGFLTETGVIMEYLHDLGQGPSYYPSDPWSRAKTRELIRYLELYLELPARRLYGEVFFGRPVDHELRKVVHKDLERGFASLSQLAHFDPWLAGREMSYADFYFYFSVGLVTRVTKKALDWDTFNEVEGIRDLMTLLAERDSVKRIEADQKA